ncbi:MAG: hypothetical protein AAF492_05600 [Verrucomicrobiota bacterium]
MKKNTVTTLIVFALAASMIWTSNQMHPHLLSQRETLNQAEPIENLPPLIALITVAAGGFRGIVADVLWVRVTKLQNAGKYLELVQLSDWITKLEPRVDSVWVYHVWNLSYNVSVMFPDVEDRWRWVSHGLDLLRDKGLQYNPNSARLYQEMAWIFNHKLGAQLDRAHWYYKNAWKDEMGLLFSGPRPDYERYLAVPATSAELLADPEIRDLVEQLGPFKVKYNDKGLLQRKQLSEPLQELLNTHPAAERLLDFLKVQTLDQHYRMPVAAMKRLEDTFGPLDWRYPHTHASYWAFEGKAHADGFTQVTLNRLLFQSMMNNFIYGRIVIDPHNGEVFTTANPDMARQTDKAFRMAIKEVPDNATYHQAYGHFLLRGAIELLSYNREDESLELLETYREKYMNHENPWTDDQLMFNFLARGRANPSVGIVNAIMGEMVSLEHRWKAIGDENRSRGYARLNQLVREQAATLGIEPDDDQTIIKTLRAKGQMR